MPAQQWRKLYRATIDIWDVTMQLCLIYLWCYKADWLIASLLTFRSIQLSLAVHEFRAAEEEHCEQAHRCVCVCKLLMPLGQYGIWKYAQYVEECGRQMTSNTIPLLTCATNGIQFQFLKVTRLFRPPKSVLPCLIYIYLPNFVLQSILHSLTDRILPAASWRLHKEGERSMSNFIM